MAEGPAELPESQEHASRHALAARRRLWLTRLAMVVVVAAVLWLVYYLLIGRNYVSTDNAYVNAEVAQVTPQIAAKVLEVRVKDTQHVKRGDVLVLLDSSSALIAVAEAEAQLAEARRRFREMVATGGSLSARIASRNAEVAGAQAQLGAAQAEFEKARIAVIRAPIDGVVAKRTVQVGQRVDIGKPILAIVPVDKVYVDANFKEVQLRRVRVGMPAEVTADLYGGSVTYHGKVAGISGGTGASMSLIPAQNATGNWIKVVQRLPVRIELDPRSWRNIRCASACRPKSRSTCRATDPWRACPKQPRRRC
jgi:membrane fusion protein (multidrug efflux system)